MSFGADGDGDWGWTFHASIPPVLSAGSIPPHMHGEMGAASTDEIDDAADFAVGSAGTDVPADCSRAEKEERKRSHRPLPTSPDAAPRVPKRCAVPAIDDGGPPLRWEDIALLLQGLPGPIVAEGEREHVMSGCESPRRVFVERQATRRKPGGDKWLCSGGKKGSTVYWIRPQLGICKRYGKCVATNRKMSDLPLRVAHFTLIGGTPDKPLWKIDGPSVFVLYVARQEDLRASASRAGAREKEGWASQVGTQSASQVFEGSHGSAAVLDLVQRYGKNFISFQTMDDDGKSIELGAIEKGGNGITLSSSQGDFAEWHPRVKMEPQFNEGDVVGFTRRGEITRLCSVTGRMLLGVISRKAIVAGSAPPMAERDLYDTVAYCGRVPVRVVPRSDDSLPGISVQSVCTTQCGTKSMGPTAGDILVPSGRCDGTAVAISVDEMHSGSLVASRKVGVVLENYEWSGDEDRDKAGLLVEAIIVPPANTVAGSTRTSVRLTLSLLSAVLVAGCLVVAASLLAHAGLPQQRGPMPTVPAPSCCCTQRGRSTADCGVICSCVEECTHICAPSAWDLQCRMPYINISDDFRNVKHRVDFDIPFVRAHADAPQNSLRVLPGHELSQHEEYEKLCPDSPWFDANPRDDVWYETTGVGGGQWYRFVGDAGDALPLHPSPQYQCGTANGGWLSGYNRNSSASNSRRNDAVATYIQYEGQVASGTGYFAKLPSNSITACESVCNASEACLGFARSGASGDRQPCLLYDTVPSLSYAPGNEKSWWQKPGRAAPVAPSLESCARDSALFAQCSKCPRGVPGDRAVRTPGDLCRDHCYQQPNASSPSGLRDALGWCGESGIHVHGDVANNYTQGIDCRPCQFSLLWTLQGDWYVETSNVPPRTYSLTIGGTTGTYGPPDSAAVGIISGIFVDEKNSTFRLDWDNLVYGDSGFMNGWFKSRDAIGRDHMFATYTIGSMTYDVGPKRRYTWNFSRQILGPQSLTGGPPTHYVEPGQYPTASEGKVERTVCFSAGQMCTGTGRQNEVCGGATCLRHQSIYVVRCDGFFLWQLDFVPYCRSGFCTANASEVVSSGR